MPIPTKHHTQRNTQEIIIKDIGLSSAATAKGWSVDLVDSGNGMILFRFKGDPQEFSQLEADYWAGKLNLPARAVIMAQRTLKDRLYALKKPTGGRS